MEDLFEVKSINDFVGNKKMLETIRDWIKNIKNTDKILIIGPPGIGKTKYVELVCQEFQYDFIKIDSTCCNHSKDFIDRLMKIHQWKDITQSFQEHPKPRIVLIDELETLIKVDRNIPSYLIKFWEKSEKPLPYILIGQYEADKKISELRKQCAVLYLQRIQDNDMFLYLKSKIPRNKVKLSDLMKIAEDSNGSIYAAIHAIIGYTQSKKQIVNYGKDKTLELGDIFQYKNYTDIYMLLSEDPWIHPLKILENAPKVYSKNEYMTFLKDYLAFEELIYNNDLSYDLSIGFLSQLILNYNLQLKKPKQVDIQFTKLLSYISTQKKLHRSLYEKIPKEIPINEIGFYWIHQYLQSNKKFC
jgi:DNA polymerase III delta prime subunit